MSGIAVQQYFLTVVSVPRYSPTVVPVPRYSPTVVLVPRCSPKVVSLSRGIPQKWYYYPAVLSQRFISPSHTVCFSLNVDDTMLRPFLETLTIEEAIQNQKLFLVDLGIVEGVPPAPGTQVSC